MTLLVSRNVCENIANPCWFLVVCMCMGCMPIGWDRVSMQWKLRAVIWLMHMHLCWHLSKMTTRYLWNSDGNLPADLIVAVWILIYRVRFCLDPEEEAERVYFLTCDRILWAINHDAVSVGPVVTAALLMGRKPLSCKPLSVNYIAHGRQWRLVQRVQQQWIVGFSERSRSLLRQMNHSP